MVLGCFKWKGVGNICKISGTINKYQCLSILKTSLKDSLRSFDFDDPIFQQDNDPKNTSGLLRKYLDQWGGLHSHHV